jgi:fido (protein-threonine AMPylation protein)
MSDQQAWKLELEEYVRQGEPNRAEKSAAWQAAIGLQAVDGLQTSEYLLQTAKEHIEGEIDMPAAKRRIQSYYEQRSDRQAIETGTMEADIVSVRIAELLSEKTFQFSPVTLQNIHRRLFSGVFDHAGQIRDYNITKKEWVLNGETVIYASYDSIRDTLAYDFNSEKNFSYENLSVPSALKHIAKFTADLWQIHPFGEGNTRSTAVFIIMYLKTFGFKVNNDVFADNSWYFRNALVRANFNDLQKGIHATTEYLELFFENLLMNTHHELKNRYLHVDYATQFQSANFEISKCQNVTLGGTLNCTLEELAVLRLIASNPRVTQKALSELTGKSERTIKRRMTDLQEKGYLRRVNGKRNGHWELLVEL